MGRNKSILDVVILNAKWLYKGIVSSYILVFWNQTIWLVEGVLNKLDT